MLNIGLVVQPLTLQVADFDIVAVDQDQPSDSRPRHRTRVKTPERAAADNCNVDANNFSCPMTPRPSKRIWRE